jgi:hyperosmotically inducible periplasmic protein
MKRKMKNMVLSLAGALLLVPFAEAAISTAQTKHGLTKIEQDVRHELVMLPYFGVFDNLEFQVNGDTVILSGQVTRPTLQKDAERVVSRIEGVTKVVNNIEVLPLSPFDNQIRLAAYRQIYGFGPLTRYKWGPVPPIHIIVKNGNITLTGIVANETDKNIANIRANGVSGAFSVSNDLRIDKRG